HARSLVFRVKIDQLVQMLREIEDNRNVAALASQAGASPAREQRRAKTAALFHCHENVFHRLRDHNTDRYLAIVRPIRRVERATAVVEPDLAFNPALQLSFESLCR